MPCLAKDGIVLTETISIPARVENLYELLSWVDEKMVKAGLDSSALNKILLASEEIFVNIANYAYAEREGFVLVKYMMFEGGAAIEFRDNGTPFNPLQNKAPDLSAPLEERPIGGLGVFILKNFMDDIHYRYENGQNVLYIGIRSKS